ncbi:tail fiber domain-containing protein [Hymenobacter ruricola]|uniref:Tail fiber domain-containing protein n=1 Tax=Hymenobacter ruricola TaxID=2791023 RepID=A0ABS0I836_9BACT|nr:tail fiber domain-containing protein [Hymenobacter ruricola]MBF9223100.1 tail fiber domain-containing protein [Hymenobacter ruricola]
MNQCFTNRLLSALAAALLGLTLPLSALAQGVSIGAPAPNASAVLDVSSTTKGLLPPRMTQAQRDDIRPAASAAGLQVYNLDTQRLNFWDGTSWQEVLGAGPLAPSGSTAVYTYTGTVQRYQVPAGVTRVLVTATGAAGIMASTTNRGARVTATLAVVPGEVLAVVVGGQPNLANNGYGQAGGYNGGGPDPIQGYNGGGGTDLRRVTGASPLNPLALGGTLAGTLTSRLLVAGGGGGGGGTNGGAGGGGFAATDFSGNPGQGGKRAGVGEDGGQLGGHGNPTAGSGGGGGLTSGGVSGGTGSSDGALGTGGAGYGGGGGGYYGGSGGCCGLGAAGGGGGSSWVSNAAAIYFPTFEGNVQTGSGQLSIQPVVVTAAPVLDGTNFVNVAGTWTVSGADVYRPAGYVGIGTNTPGAPLDVRVVQPGYPYSGYGYLGPGGTGTNAGSSTGAVSIRATGQVVATQFIATSDERLKTVLGRSDRAADLALLNQLRITDYQMRDRAQFGEQKFKKVLAQEVEQVLPQAVSRHADFLPDVYQLASQVRAQPGDSLLTVALPTALAVPAAVGQRLKLVGPAGEVLARVARPAAVGTRALVVRDAGALAGARVFVFGLEHPDVRAVDYEALAMLNVSATQELARQVAALQRQSAALAARAATAEAAAAAAETNATRATASLASFEQRLRALEAGGAQARK